jgi:hypothetical protein
MSNPAIEIAFSSFAEASGPRERQRALTDLLTHRAVPKQAEDSRFVSGVAHLERDAERSDLPEHRILAISELSRAAQVVKALQPRLKRVMDSAGKRPLPSAAMLKDANERFYLAKAIAISPHPWVSEYSAMSIAMEEAGEKARGEFMDLLLNRSKSAAEALSLLRLAFSSIQIETESPAESMARRLTRTLISFREKLLSSRVEAGRDVGRELDSLLKGMIGQAGIPSEKKVQIDLAREVILVLHELVRTRFSVSTESSTFDSLRVCRRMFPGTEWPRELTEYLDLLATDILEALLLLGRQDVPSQGLLEHLILVCGHRGTALALTGELADNHPELPEQIRGWMRRGRFVAKIESSTALEESLLREIDAAIGFALIEIEQIRGSADLAAHVGDAMRVFEPSLSSGVDLYFSQIERLCKAVEEIAKRREIALLGVVGEKIRFSPKYFDVLSADVAGEVGVLRPAVVRANASGSADVIVKGLAGN